MTDKTTMRTWRLERLGLVIAILGIMGNAAMTGGAIGVAWVANAAFAGWILREMSGTKR